MWFKLDYKVDINFHTEVSAQISIKIDKFNYQKAVDLIVDLEITSNKQLVKSILEFDSLKDTINKIKQPTYHRELLNVQV